MRFYVVALRELAETHVPYGYRRLTGLLRLDGWQKCQADASTSQIGLIKLGWLEISGQSHQSLAEVRHGNAKSRDF
jgi:hypothetical protein